MREVVQKDLTKEGSTMSDSRSQGPEDPHSPEGVYHISGYGPEGTYEVEGPEGVEEVGVENRFRLIAEEISVTTDNGVQGIKLLIQDNQVAFEFEEGTRDI